MSQFEYADVQESPFFTGGCGNSVIRNNLLYMCCVLSHIILKVRVNSFLINNS